MNRSFPSPTLRAALAAALLVAAFFADASRAVADGLTLDFAYTGRLTEPDGRPVTGPLALQIAFYRQAVDGAPLLTVTQGLEAVPLSDGLFSVRLAIPAEDYHAVFAGVTQPVYVEVTDLSRSPATSYPRQLVSTQPYAAKVPVDERSLRFDELGRLTLGTGSDAAAGQFLTQDEDGKLVWRTPTTAAANLGVAAGGTGGATPAAARANLGLAIGTDVQSYSARLGELSALAPASDAFVVGNGATFATIAGGGARSALGLGTLATQSAAAVAITGGTIAGITSLAVADGGTGAATAAGARANLGAAAAGANADITALSGLTTALSVAQGGTGATTASTGRANLGAAAAGANTDITALSGLTTALSVAQGGTGATTAATSRASLGLVVGTDVQAHGARLLGAETCAACIVADGNPPGTP